MKSHMNLNIQCQIVHKPNFKQHGVVLFLALIALLVMSLAAVALIRSVDTNSLIAGNLAFRQAATASADAGVEAAVAWIKANSSGGTLNNNVPAVAYYASYIDPNKMVGIDYTPDPNDLPGGYWSYLKSKAATGTAGFCHLPMNGGVCSNAPDSVDAAGNKVDFMIHRICLNTGAPDDNAECIKANGGGGQVGSSDSAEEPWKAPEAVYYRVLVRVEGPRDTVSYVQAMFVV